MSSTTSTRPRVRSGKSRSASNRMASRYGRSPAATRSAIPATCADLAPRPQGFRGPPIASRLAAEPRASTAGAGRPTQPGKGVTMPTYEITTEDVEYLRHGDKALTARLYKPKGE